MVVLLEGILGIRWDGRIGSVISMVLLYPLYVGERTFFVLPFVVLNTVKLGRL